MIELQRRHARELVLKALYANETGEVAESDALRTIITDPELASKAQEFAINLFKATRKYRLQADTAISNLATNWSLERIAELDKHIMRMAMVELTVMPDVPAKVVLNEAIELAKTYSTAESSSFINGILDQFLKKVERLAEPV